MRIPSWMMVAASVMMAFPFGWGLGVFVAYVIAGKNFGQLPVATVPLGIVAALVFAVAPFMDASKRLKIMLGGTLIFIAFAWLIA